MNTLFLFLIFFTFLSSTCMADMMAFNGNSNANIPPGILNKQNIQTVQKPDAIELQKITIHPKRRISLSMDTIVQTSAKEENPISEALTPLSIGNRYVDKKTPGLIPTLSPDHAIKQGFLSLSKVPNNRRPRAIMFVFLMNKDKSGANKDSSRVRMHILGSPKVFKEQKIIENELPLDVSMAKYEDGYAPEEWNLVLPNKKPREVRVSLLWSF